MPRSVSANEAKNKLGSLIGWVVENRDEVIVESHGRPRAVLMSFAEYETIQALREQARRAAALDQLRQARQRSRSRNDDLTDEQAVELAERFSRELIDDLASEGRLRFERDAT